MNIPQNNNINNYFNSSDKKYFYHQEKFNFVNIFINLIFHDNKNVFYLINY